MRGERLALWWADRYTRGLQKEARAERRAELASDLWEHRAALGAGRRTQLAIISRCARGVPADLSWRRAQRRGSRLPSRGAVARGVGWVLAAIAYVGLTLLHGWVALPLIGLEYYGADWEDGGAQAYARIGGALFALLVVGALLLVRLPRTGAALIAAGALGTPVAFLWGAFVYLPIGAAVTVGAIKVARRRCRTLQARASAATS